jgi:hypothetical protein
MLHEQKEGKMIKKIGLILLIFTFAFSFSGTKAQVKGEGLTISPPLAEMTLNAGETYPAKIKVTNPTEEMVEVYPLVMNFRASGEGGEPSFYPASEEEAKFSLANWVKFNQTKLALTPEQVVEFDYEIAVPSGAEPGGHYGVVFFSTKAPELQGDASQVAIASMVGTLILVKVPGAIEEKASLLEFSTNKKFYFNLPVDFTTKISNFGNIHFKPKGEIKISGWKDGTTLTFNESKGNVLPESTRKFANKWEKKAANFLDVPIGKFKANLNLAYGEGNKNLTSSIYFWIIPLWLIIAAAVVLILIIVIITWLIIRRRRKARILGNLR